jgi:hypothetical protein
MTSTIGIPIKLLNEAQVSPYFHTPPFRNSAPEQSSAIESLLIVFPSRDMLLLSKLHQARCTVANSSKVRLSPNNFLLPPNRFAERG